MSTKSAGKRPGWTREAAIRKFRIAAADGKSYETTHYDLDVIISGGYRVKSWLQKMQQLA